MAPAEICARRASGRAACVAMMPPTSAIKPVSCNFVFTFGRVSASFANKSIIGIRGRTIVAVQRNCAITHCSLRMGGLRGRLLPCFTLVNPCPHLGQRRPRVDRLAGNLRLASRRRGCAFQSPVWESRRSNPRWRCGASAQRAHAGLGAVSATGILRHPLEAQALRICWLFLAEWALHLPGSSALDATAVRKSCLGFELNRDVSSMIRRFSCRGPSFDTGVSISNDSSANQVS